MRSPYKPLSSAELDQAVQHLPNWEIRDGKLSKTFTFADFIEAWAFMTQVALLAESLKHHPDWSNVYNRLTITLFTHDANGITRLDLELAQKIENICED